MKTIKKQSEKLTDKITKPEAKKQMVKLRKKLFNLQNLFYANHQHSLLIILQGMDTSGKDGVIRHVFSYINPQGCNVQSFKSPTPEEKSHDFLWRVSAHVPQKGMFQIFNRSQYEDLLFPIVHGLLEEHDIIERIKVINDFEKYLEENNTIVLKFYLQISEKEQQKRLNERITDPEKKWKYNANDKKEAKKWETYMDAYQRVLLTANESNPWIVVPSNKKWYRNYLVANTVVNALEKLKMKYPQ